ncbi:MAG: galactose mutarotase [Clostridia bacterium]|nr:galactose mutarotase [Clostridia bacterium]
MKTLFYKLPTGEEIFSYRIRGEHTEAEILTRGATLRSLWAYGTDVVCGFDMPEVYIENPGYLGAVVGRVANRIKDGELYIDGECYNLTKNEPHATLHGGESFAHRNFTVTEYKTDSITLAYTSPDGEGGFPGEVAVSVTYTVEGDALIIDYTAIPNKKTAIALTNHAYFNLDGCGSISNHRLKIWAEEYTEVNENLIPTGNHPAVSGTPFDFSTMRRIGDGFLSGISGYDHNFLLSPDTYGSFNEKELGLAAVLEGEQLRMYAYTDQPGVQIYTANHFGAGPLLKGGVPSVKHGAVCLEMQTEPNSANRGVGIYGAGEIYRQTTAYKFEVK